MSFSQEDFENPYSPVIVEDLLNGINEWRNIQDIVRLTFKALSDVVKAQGAKIHELEQGVAARPTKSEISVSLSEKANLKDLNQLISDLDNYQPEPSNYYSIEELRRYTDRKADQSEVEKQIENLHSRLESVREEMHKYWQQAVHQKELEQVYYILDTKVSGIDLESGLQTKASKEWVANALNRKVDRHEIENWLGTKADSRTLSACMAALEHKAEISDHDSLSKEFESLKEELEDKLSFRSFSELETQLRGEIENVSKRTKSSKKVSVLESELKKLKDSMTEVCRKETTEANNRLERKFLAKLKKVSEEDLKLVKCELEKNVEDLRKKTECDNLEIQKVKDQLKAKLNKKEVNSLLNQYEEKVERKFKVFAEEIQNSVEDQEKHYNRLLEKKADSSELKSLKEPKDLNNWKKCIEKELLLKANIKDVTTLSDSKLSVEEFDSALTTIFNNLQTKVNLEDFDFQFKTQEGINQTLCTENCVARWMWKSGSLSNQKVPWEVQMANTCAENFKWQEGHTQVITQAGGLYWVYGGFFCSTECKVVLQVNQEQVVCTESSLSSYLGGGFSEFLSLPPKASICVVFYSQSLGEGFLGLKKL